MVHFRKIAALLAALCFLFSAALAESPDMEVEDLPPLDAENPLPEDALLEEDSEDAGISGEPAFTPSYGSPWAQDIGSSYWTCPMDITDEKTVWNMLMEPITVVDLKAKNSPTKQRLFMYREPDASSKIVGEITNLSQGLRVIQHLDNGWSLVECYSSSFANHPKTEISAWNILVSGYVESKYLTQVQPTDELALVVDKLAQRLYVFSKGELVSELLISTGKANNKQPFNETRSGEFLIINMTGQLTSDNLICYYAMRFNGGDEIHEVPYVKNADGTKNYKASEPKLGTKASHGCIRVQRLPDPNGYNMEKLYNIIKSKKLCGSKNGKPFGYVKIVVWEDWQGRQLPVPDPDTVLYYNPNKGSYYHRYDHCTNGKGITFTPFSYSQLDEGNFKKLKPCDRCSPVRRLAEIQEINDLYAPGGDHDPVLTKARQKYYDYLEK